MSFQGRHWEESSISPFLSLCTAAISLQALLSLPTNYKFYSHYILIRKKQFPLTEDTMTALKNSMKKENLWCISDWEDEQKVRVCEKLNEILEGEPVKYIVKVPSGRIKDNKETKANTVLPPGHEEMQGKYTLEHIAPRELKNTWNNWAQIYCNSTRS